MASRSMLAAATAVAAALLLPVASASPVTPRNASSSASAAPKVTLENGLTVLGRVGAETPNVAEYLGIPYAKPPIDDLRCR